MRSKKALLEMVRVWSTLDEEARENAIEEIKEGGFTKEEDIIFALAMNGGPKTAAEIADDSLKSDEEFMNKMEVHGFIDFFKDKNK